jgi:tRNA-binding protein
MINASDFNKLDIRVGKIKNVNPFSEGKHSSHVLEIDFGPEIGLKKSLAKLTPNYGENDILKKQVLCVINLEPKQIGPHISEVLTLGVPDEKGNVILVQPEKNVPLGRKLC